MPIVGGLDIHRKQLTFDYLDTVTGEARRGQIAPAGRGHLATAARSLTHPPARRTRQLSGERELMQVRPQSDSHYGSQGLLLVGSIRWRGRRPWAHDVALGVLPGACADEEDLGSADRQVVAVVVGPAVMAGRPAPR
jgi:hypothetical protein